MPEGPTIYLLTEDLSSFQNQRVVNVRGNSKAGIDEINGLTVIKIINWGKHLLICLTNNITIRVHFMLFGSCTINEKKQRPERLGLDFANGGEVNFYSCSVKLLKGDIGTLYDWSSDVLNEEWDELKAKQKVLEHSGELICDVLLNQNIFSGVGNIIKNEVLFRTRLQPESIVEKIPETRLIEVIRDARNFSMQFLEWKRLFVLKKNLAVHNRKMCPRCDIKITRKAQVGKTRRRAFFCENCQQLFS